MEQQRSTDRLEISSREGSQPAVVSQLVEKTARLAHENPVVSHHGSSPPPGRHGFPRLLRAAWWTSYAAAWCGALGLAALALLRIFYHDGTYLLTCINAFTFYAYLPAYVVLIWATRKRRWALAALSCFVALCHLVWVAADFTPARALEPSSAIGDVSPVIKVFYANVSAYNKEHLDLLAEVAREDPDVIVLVEYRRWWQVIVMSLPFAKKYHYGTGITQEFLGEMAVFSKLPITNVERHWPTGRQICLVDVQVGTEPLRLFCLHSPRPMQLSGHAYFEYWDETLPLVGAQRGPLVVVGDFNATQHSNVHRQLIAGGMRSAHVDRGSGYATSWPNWQFLAPPIRIDHALLSPEVECLSIREGEGRGSDHRPLIFDVRIRRREPSAAAPPGGRS